MLKHFALISLLLTTSAAWLASPATAQPNCTAIPGVTAAWSPGQTPPPSWQGDDPDTLLDGATGEAWYHYWEGGPQIPVVFTLPSGYEVTAVSWHDHYGDGDVSLEATGQTLTFSTDRWPLGWHQEAWSLSGVTSISLTTSSNNTKISELAFCGSRTAADTTPPEAVGAVTVSETCTSVSLSWPAARDFDGTGTPSGFAERYLVSWNGQPEVEVTGTSYQISAAPETAYSISVVAVDAAGNQSSATNASAATPACPTGGGCSSSIQTTAGWQAGSTPPAGWQAPPPSILVDGVDDVEWFYYWEPGPSVPVVFQLPAGSNISAIEWRDHYGDGSITLTANGQSTTFSTDLWPLGWHTQAWSVSNVSSVSMTTSSNNTKITELRFCGASGPGDSVPPDPVADLAALVTGCTSADLDWTAPADYDASGANGTASSYQIWSGANPPVSTTATEITLGDLVPDASNTITIVALDTAGNQSQPASVTVTTPPCTGGDLDKYPQTVHIVDSFGQEVAPVTSGHQWHAIDEYYDDYYADGTHDWSLEGMCSKTIHNSYWVLADENGQPAGSADHDGDGDYESYYPTWHPPIHDEGGPEECYFMHEHGEDPRTSPLYDLDDALSIGMPFGYVHSKLGNLGGRLEDHVGHKVVVENDYTLVYGNPYQIGSVFDETGDTCNWLSKIHQGSHSSDALGNNLHEYFFNVVCNDSAATHVRVKELVTWGFPHLVFNECSAEVGWFWAGYEATDPVHSPTGPHAPPGATLGPFHDGKREFGCTSDRHAAVYDAGSQAGQPKTLAELWKPDSHLSAPNGEGSVFFSPYYVTRNPSRYVDPLWETRFDSYVHDTYLGFSCDSGDSNGDPTDNCQSHADCTDQHSGLHDGCEGTGAMVSSVDLCVRGSDAWQLSVLAFAPQYATPGQYPGFCDLLDSGLRTAWEQEIAAAGGDTLALSEARKYHPENPFDGTIRGVHPKDIQIYAAGPSTGDYKGLNVFCTDAFGDGSEEALFAAGEPSCPEGKILQAFSPQNNNWSPIAGSSVGAIDGAGNPQDPANPNETGLVGGGEGAEFVIDGISDSTNKVRPPN